MVFHQTEEKMNDDLKKALLDEVTLLKMILESEGHHAELAAGGITRILKLSILYCGQLMARELKLLFFGLIRKEAGLCPNCDSPYKLPPGINLCQRCQLDVMEQKNRLLTKLDNSAPVSPLQVTRRSPTTPLPLIERSDLSTRELPAIKPNR